jgi:Natural resistance-associated macrophage protein
MLAALRSGPDWSDALSGVLLPRITWSNEYFTTLVAILGTTISPYLFFWQASQEEAEDVHVDRRRKPHPARHSTRSPVKPIHSSAWPSPTSSRVQSSLPQPQRFHRNFDSGGRSAQTKSPERLPSRCSQSACNCFVTATRARTPLERIFGWRRPSSAKAGGGLCAAATRNSAPLYSSKTGGTGVGLKRTGGLF